MATTPNPDYKVRLNELLSALGLKPGSNDSSPTTYTTTSEPLEHRKAPAFPFENNVTFVALTVGTTPMYHEEDEVRWVTAIGCAYLDTGSLALLPPGKDGVQWADEIRTQVITVDGRQGHGDASACISGSETRPMSIADAKNFITNGFESSGKVILVTDNIAERKMQLDDSFSCSFYNASRVVNLIDAPKLYRAAFPPDQASRGPRTLRELCTNLNIATGDMRNVGNRASYILQVMLATAVRSAPKAVPKTSNSAAPPNPPSRASHSAAGTASDPQANISSATPSTQGTPRPSPTSHAAGNSTTAAAHSGTPVQVKTTLRNQPSATAAVTAASSSATTAANTSSTRAPVAETAPVPSTQAAATPRTQATAAPRTQTTPTSSAQKITTPKTPATATVEPYDQKDFTADDRRTVDVSNDEISDLPRRIYERVAKYTRKTEDFETKLISVAAGMKYPNLESITQGYTDERTGSRRTKISAPITNFETLTRHVCRTYTVPSRFVESLKEVITLRAFVSDWYSNIPGIPDGCEVAWKTKQHRAFVDMLRRLLPVLEQPRQV